MFSKTFPFQILFNDTFRPSLTALNVSFCAVIPLSRLPFQGLRACILQWVRHISTHPSGEDYSIQPAQIKQFDAVRICRNKTIKLKAKHILPQVAGIHHMPSLKSSLSYNTGLTTWYWPWITQNHPLLYTSLTAFHYNLVDAELCGDPGGPG